VTFGIGVASLHPSALSAAIGCKLQELPLHGVDLGDVGRDEMISAPFAGNHLKVTPALRPFSFAGISS
jgi:hypothetical protein